MFNLGGEFFALINRCPHEGAPLAAGLRVGLSDSDGPGHYTHSRPGELLRCPWHGWEFDMETGVGLYDPYRHERVATYEVRVEGEEVVLLA